MVRIFLEVRVLEKLPGLLFRPQAFIGGDARVLCSVHFDVEVGRC